MLRTYTYIRILDHWIPLFFFFLFKGGKEALNSTVEYTYVPYLYPFKPSYLSFFFFLFLSTFIHSNINKIQRTTKSEKQQAKQLKNPIQIDNLHLTAWEEIQKGGSHLGMQPMKVMVH